MLIVKFVLISKLIKRYRPTVCQNVISGPLNNDGTNQFHNHIIGNILSNPITIIIANHANITLHPTPIFVLLIFMYTIYLLHLFLTQNL